MIVSNKLTDKIYFEKYVDKIYANSGSTDVKKNLITGKIIIFDGNEEVDVTNFKNSIKKIKDKTNVTQ